MAEEKPTIAQLALGIAAAALEAYAASPVVRAMVVAVPFVGASFDALAGTADADLMVERIEVLGEELGQRLQGSRRGFATSR